MSASTSLASLMIRRPAPIGFLLGTTMQPSSTLLLNGAFGRRLFSNTAAGGPGGAPAAATTSCGGLRAIFPLRLTLGGAAALLAVGFVDGLLSAEWYFSREGAKKSAGTAGAEA